jgi:low temperature requirement protein LtrA
MTSLIAHAGFLRDKASAGASRVAPVELFFDLVFVFAITQLSHGLLAKLTPVGLVETTILFLAVWWTWICTSWATNWLDPDRWPVRLFLFAVMLGGLVLSASIPTAFGAGALVFALAHAAILVGRPLFVICALGEASPGNRRNFQRILAWACLSSTCWVAGAFADGPARIAIWSLALLLDYGPAWFGFRFPGLGASSTTDWDIDGHHLSERCALFVIIALGESLLITGTTAQKLPVTVATVSAFVSAFVATVAMWWLYFAIGAERATHHIARSDDPGRMARSG